MRSVSIQSFYFVLSWFTSSAELQESTALLNIATQISENNYDSLSTLGLELQKYYQDLVQPGDHESDQLRLEKNRFIYTASKLAYSEHQLFTNSLAFLLQIYFYSDEYTNKWNGGGEVHHCIVHTIIGYSHFIQLDYILNSPNHSNDLTPDSKKPEASKFSSARPLLHLPVISPVSISTNLLDCIDLSHQRFLDSITSLNIEEFFANLALFSMCSSASRFLLPFAKLRNIFALDKKTVLSRISVVYRSFTLVDLKSHLSYYFLLSRSHLETIIQNGTTRDGEGESNYKNEKKRNKKKQVKKNSKSNEKGTDKQEENRKDSYRQFEKQAIKMRDGDNEIKQCLHYFLRGIFNVIVSVLPILGEPFSRAKDRLWRRVLLSLSYNSTAGYLELYDLGKYALEDDTKRSKKNNKNIEKEHSFDVFLSERSNLICSVEKKFLSSRQKREDARYGCEDKDGNGNFRNIYKSIPVTKNVGESIFSKNITRDTMDKEEEPKVFVGEKFYKLFFHRLYYIEGVRRVLLEYGTSRKCLHKTSRYILDQPLVPMGISDRIDRIQQGVVHFSMFDNTKILTTILKNFALDMNRDYSVYSATAETPAIIIKTDSSKIEHMEPIDHLMGGESDNRIIRTPEKPTNRIKSLVESEKRGKKAKDLADSSKRRLTRQQSDESKLPEEKTQTAISRNGKQYNIPYVPSGFSLYYNGLREGGEDQIMTPMALHSKSTLLWSTKQLFFPCSVKKKPSTPQAIPVRRDSTESKQKSSSDQINFKLTVNSLGKTMQGTSKSLDSIIDNTIIEDNEVKLPLTDALESVADGVFDPLLSPRASKIMDNYSPSPRSFASSNTALFLNLGSTVKTEVASIVKSNEDYPTIPEEECEPSLEDKSMTKNIKTKKEQEGKMFIFKEKNSILQLDEKVAIEDLLIWIYQNILTGEIYDILLYLERIYEIVLDRLMETVEKPMSMIKAFFQLECNRLLFLRNVENKNRRELDTFLLHPFFLSLSLSPFSPHFESRSQYSLTSSMSTKHIRKNMALSIDRVILYMIKLIIWTSKDSEGITHINNQSIERAPDRVHDINFSDSLSITTSKGSQSYPEISDVLRNKIHTLLSGNHVYLVFPITKFLTEKDINEITGLKHFSDNEFWGTESMNIKESLEKSEKSMTILHYLLTAKDISEEETVILGANSFAFPLIYFRNFSVDWKEPLIDTWQFYYEITLSWLYSIEFLVNVIKSPQESIENPSTNPPLKALLSVLLKLRKCREALKANLGTIIKTLSDLVTQSVQKFLHSKPSNPSAFIYKAIEQAYAEYNDAFYTLASNWETEDVTKLNKQIIFNELGEEIENKIDKRERRVLKHSKQRLEMYLENHIEKMNFDYWILKKGIKVGELIKDKVNSFESLHLISSLLTPLMSSLDQVYNKQLHSSFVQVFQYAITKLQLDNEKKVCVEDNKSQATPNKGQIGKEKEIDDNWLETDTLSNKETSERKRTQGTPPISRKLISKLPLLTLDSRKKGGRRAVSSLSNLKEQRKNVSLTQLDTVQLDNGNPQNVARNSKRNLYINEEIESLSEILEQDTEAKQKSGDFFKGMKEVPQSKAGEKTSDYVDMLIRKAFWLTDNSKAIEEVYNSLHQVENVMLKLFLSLKLIYREEWSIQTEQISEFISKGVSSCSNLFLNKFGIPAHFTQRRCNEVASIHSFITAYGEFVGRKRSEYKLGVHRGGENVNVRGRRVLKLKNLLHFMEESKAQKAQENKRTKGDSPEYKESSAMKKELNEANAKNKAANEKERRESIMREHMKRVLSTHINSINFYQSNINLDINSMAEFLLSITNQFLNNARASQAFQRNDNEDKRSMVEVSQVYIPDIINFSSLFLTMISPQPAGWQSLFRQIFSESSSSTEERHEKLSVSINKTSSAEQTVLSLHTEQELREEEKDEVQSPNNSFKKEKQTLRDITKGSINQGSKGISYSAKQQRRAQLNSNAGDMDMVLVMQQIYLFLCDYMYLSMDISYICHTFAALFQGTSRTPKAFNLPSENSINSPLSPTASEHSTFAANEHTSLASVFSDTPTFPTSPRSPISPLDNINHIYLINSLSSFYRKHADDIDLLFTILFQLLKAYDPVELGDLRSSNGQSRSFAKDNAIPRSKRDSHRPVPSSRLFSTNQKLTTMSMFVIPQYYISDGINPFPSYNFHFHSSIFCRHVSLLPRISKRTPSTSKLKIESLRSQEFVKLFEKLTNNLAKLSTHIFEHVYNLNQWSSIFSFDNLASASSHCAAKGRDDRYRILQDMLSKISPGKKSPKDAGEMLARIKAARTKQAEEPVDLTKRVNNFFLSNQQELNPYYNLASSSEEKIAQNWRRFIVIVVILCALFLVAFFFRVEIWKGKKNSNRGRGSNGPLLEAENENEKNKEGGNDSAHSRLSMRSYSNEARQTLTGSMEQSKKDKKQKNIGDTRRKKFLTYILNKKKKELK